MLLFVVALVVVAAAVIVVVVVTAVAAFLTLGKLLEVVDVDRLGLLAPAVAGVLAVAAVEEGLHAPRHDAAAAVALPPAMPLQLRPLAHLEELSVDVSGVGLAGALHDEGLELSQLRGLGRVPDHPHDAVSA